MVNTLREAIYKMTSQDPQHHDLPWHGINRKLDRKVKAFIKRKCGKRGEFALSLITVSFLLRA